MLQSYRQRLRRWLEFRFQDKPAPGIVADNLYGYLDALEKTNDSPNPVVEIGCAFGHTAAIAATFLARRGSRRRYVCIDTFAGFTATHVKQEVARGWIRPELGGLFKDVTLEAVRANFLKWGCNSIRTVKADISEIDLPATVSKISVALVDVDLFQPCVDAVNKTWELLDDTGAILVDDVVSDSWGGANAGYRAACEARGWRPQYFCSFGVIEKTPGSLRWKMSDSPHDRKFDLDRRRPIP